MPVDIRAPRTEEIALLEGIENAADQRFTARFHPQVWWPAPPGADRAAMPGFILVAVESVADEVVGFVHLLEVDGLAHLEQVAVLPAAGERGSGRALMQAALAEATRRGHRRVTLRTYADVPWNAPFYATCGFIESEPDVPFLHGLVQTEARLGLNRYGRRIQMTADLPTLPGAVS